MGQIALPIVILKMAMQKLKITVVLQVVAQVELYIINFLKDEYEDTGTSNHLCRKCKYNFANCIKCTSSTCLECRFTFKAFI